MNSTDSTRRFAAKSLSLTYPQCPLAKSVAAELLQASLAGHDIR